MKRFFSLLLAIVMLFAVSAGSISYAMAGECILGVDVSEHNSTVDFVALKNKNKKFVMIRLGYSDKYLDEYFWQNVKACTEAKIDFGVYLYSYAFNKAEAEAEADFVIKTLADISEYSEYFTLPVAYDLEEKTVAPFGKTQITENMVTFCDAVRGAGYTPMVYANVNWFENYIDINTAVKNNYKIWCASWYSNPDTSKQYRIGNTGVYADMWQYKGEDNTANDFDENVIYNPESIVAPLHHSVGSVNSLHSVEVTTTPATLTENGSITTVCNDCDYSCTEIIYKPENMYLGRSSYEYTGNAIGPGVTVKDSEGNTLKYRTDYMLVYDSGRTNVGTYGVTINFIGNYSGSKTLYFDITPKSSDKCKVTLSKYEYDYTGNEIGPGVSIVDDTGRKLIYKTDYTLVYDEGRVKPGVYSIKVFYQGNYSGTAITFFEIKLNDIVAKLNANSYIYTGKEIGPGVTVKDANGNTLKYKTDYVLIYQPNRINVGRYLVTVSFIGKYSFLPNQNLYFDIVPKPSSQCTAKPSAWSYYYTGKDIGPGVTVTDNTGRKLIYKTDYTLVYDKGRTNVGRYSIKVNYKGNYSGTQTIYFYIIPKNVNIQTLTPYSKGFITQWYTHPKEITGYQIQYSQNSNFSAAGMVTVNNPNTNKVWRSYMGANKRYYVRVRTYKYVTIDGKTTTLYSGWSPVKSVVTGK